jgi:phage/plasmid-associated DNA primase
MEQLINEVINRHEVTKTNNINSKLLGMYNYHNNINDTNIIPCSRFDFELLFEEAYHNEYLEWKSWIFQTKLLELSQDQTNEKLIVDFLYEIVCNNIITYSKTVWYFNGERWSNDDGQYLWNMIHKEFTNVLRSSEYDMYNTLNYTSKIGIRKNIMMDLKLRLYDRNLISNMDSNHDLLSVKNGILELSTGHLRKPRRRDFITLNTNCLYSEPKDHSELNLLYSILSQVFPEKSSFDFFLRSCSTFLEGRNSKKYLFVWWGIGNNCKTGMQTLVQSALGEYCGTAPVSLLTAKRTSSSNATPELNYIEGKLALFVQEPNQKEEIKTGRVKELTGNDKIYTRGLFEKTPRAISVRCKIVLVVNFPNVGQNTDNAFKRRILVQPFDSTFLPDDEYMLKEVKGLLKPYTFRINNKVEQLFTILGPVFLYILVKEYRKFLEEGLPIPQIVKNRTEEFLTYNNYCLKYIRKFIKHREPIENEVGIASTQIYDLFKIWMRDMFPGKHVPNNDIFCDELIGEGFVEDENGLIRGISIDNYELRTVF